MDEAELLLSPDQKKESGIRRQNLTGEVAIVNDMRGDRSSRMSYRYEREADALELIGSDGGVLRKLYGAEALRHLEIQIEKEQVTSKNYIDRLEEIKRRLELR